MFASRRAAGSHSFDTNDPYTIHTARFGSRPSLSTLGRCSRIDSWSPKAEHLLEACFYVVNSGTGKPEKMGSISTQVLISASLSLRQNEKLFLNTCSSGTPGGNRDSKNSKEKEKEKLNLFFLAVLRSHRGHGIWRDMARYGAIRRDMRRYLAIPSDTASIR